MSKFKNKSYQHNKQSDFEPEIDDVQYEPGEDELPLEAEIKEHIKEEKKHHDEPEAEVEVIAPEEEDRAAALEVELETKKKEYLYLAAEFDNFRKRTLAEKRDLIKNAGEQVLKGLLPILDDFERGLKATEDDTSGESVREGMVLIYNKLVKYLAQNGVKEMDPEDKAFDTEKHEAISVVPVPNEDQKGKIIDTVEKGYMLNDKVLRHAKVVVGQ